MDALRLGQRLRLYYGWRDRRPQAHKPFQEFRRGHGQTVQEVCARHLSDFMVSQTNRRMRTHQPWVFVEVTDIPTQARWLRCYVNVTDGQTYTHAHCSPGGYVEAGSLYTLVEVTKRRTKIRAQVRPQITLR